MVRVDADLFSELRGQLGDEISFKTYDDKRGIVLEESPELPDVRSSAQDEVRTAFADAKEAWLNSTESEREDYKEYAEENNLTLYQAWMANEIPDYLAPSNKELILTGKGIDEGLIPQPESLEFYYCFQEGTGNTVYDYKGNNDGTIENGEWVSGFEGFGGLEFDGSSTRVGFSGIGGVTEYSIMVLSKCHQINDGDYDTILTLMEDNWVIVRYTGGGKWEVNHVDTAYDGNILNISAANDTYNLWTVAWKNADEAHAYKGDVEKVTKSWPNTVADGRDNYLGYSDHYGERWLDGEVSLILVWNKKLTDSEIVQLANDLGFTS